MLNNLALLFRPKTIEELSGQKHLSATTAPFYKLLKSNTMSHALFFGPAGVGKTTLARIVALHLDLPYYELDATSVKVDEIRKILSQHKNALQKPLIFIDEIHRLSKTQQEVLLLPMENHEAIVIGASTENPYFVLSSGVRSRMMLFEFYPLEANDLEAILMRVSEKIEFTIDEDAKAYLVSSSAGDSRALLNLLEFSLKVDLHVKLETLKNLRPSALKDGVSSDNTHYNLISAMIKSVRGSDTDAALYYLARLIDGGESPDFIARRMIILASEDIGNANPNALNLAASTLVGVSKIGYPEARIMLSQCLIYLCACPKSNSAYKAINEAMAYVKEEKALGVPEHLKSPSPKGYLYPHDFGGWVEQAYLEKPLHFYKSSSIGYEKTLDEWMAKIKTKDKMA